MATEPSTASTAVTTNVAGAPLALVASTVMSAGVVIAGGVVSAWAIVMSTCSEFDNFEPVDGEHCVDLRDA